MAFNCVKTVGNAWKFDICGNFEHERWMTVVETLAVRDPLKTDRVYEALRHRIRTLQLAPGSAIRKEDVASEFGVSRAPVNDAIARLAEEGLVDVFPQHGSFVAQLRGDDVREGLFIRIALEIEAVRRATELNDKDLIATLQSNIAGQEAALACNDLEELYRLDQAMHKAISAAVSSPRAEKILDAARAPLDRMSQIVYPFEGRPQTTVREHRAIVDAITSGDPHFAAAAMRAHLNAFLIVVEAQLQTLESAQQ
jgi:GntR family transcriptional regulator, rspAB operon transcriptional repressor